MLSVILSGEETLTFFHSRAVSCLPGPLEAGILAPGRGRTYAVFLSPSREVSYNILLTW